MDFNDAVLFARVVDAGSFTAAAAAARLPKSSVSRRVARLEEDLGVRLLQRTTRRLALTEAGQTFYDRIRGAVGGLEEAANAVRELGGEPRGLVRVTAPADAYALGLPEAVARFVERYPKIVVELSLTSRVVDLVGEGFDLALRAGKLADSSLVSRRLGASELALFASPGYLRKRGRPKRLADLAGHACVLFRGHGGKATWRLTGPDGEEEVEVHGAIGADDMAFAASTAAAGSGMAMLPIMLAHPFLERGELETVLPRYRFVGGAVHLVVPTATFLPARVALLRDFLAEHITKALNEAQKSCRKHAA